MRVVCEMQAERADWSHAMKLYNQAKQSNHSHRCSVNYKIEIARTVRAIS